MYYKNYNNKMTRVHMTGNLRSMTIHKEDFS